MTGLLIALIAAAPVAAITGRIAREMQWRVERRELREAHERERAQWHRERSELLNRIKPETAQLVDPDVQRVSHPAIDIDDDTAFWRSRGIEVEQ